MAASVSAQSVQISGGADGRMVGEDFRTVEAVMEGVFLNVQKTFRDEMGDRWLAAFQVDWEDNFRELLPYQTFLQYKGPLGRWNIRAGHFLLPFSLQSTHDTERLLFRTLEEDMTGMRLDWGLGSFGYAGDFNWFAALTSGLGEAWPVHAPEGLVATGRIGYEDQAWSGGVSVLAGEGRFVPDENRKGIALRQQKAAVDVSAFLGPWVLRAEGIGGREEDRVSGGGNLLVDVALSRFWEINGKAALLHRESLRSEAGGGLTFQWQGFKARLADAWIRAEGRHFNRAEAQIYYDFSKSI